MEAPGNRATWVLGRGPAVFWALSAGGVLWIVHGYFRIITPYGPDTVWRKDLGYSPIISPELFVLYNLPGGLALLLAASAAFSFLSALGAGRSALNFTARMLVLAAFLLGLVAMAGQLFLFSPPTVVGISFGMPALGLALILTGVMVAKNSDGLREHRRMLGPGLILLGTIGLFILPLWPMMYAMGWLPLWFGALIYAACGAGWVILGVSLRPASGSISTTAEHFRD
ncbi:hypothetical protein SPF06_20110 [Sinomonas sp. JGH33]|uniref:DUF998 domain-containing protein n=1 Tax=Sinomonas terricola TaxID=3110330 RepID=A0ABU5TBG6_9MICC|nr:hypothetical protein [Sinomonas sp. JGH33]MEA5457035.1 hypothetical protein [Sinomonas sp. JGH33]